MLPSTHSILAFSCATPLFVTKLYVITPILNDGNYLMWAPGSAKSSTTAECKGIGRIGRCSTTFNIMDTTSLISNDESTLELAHILGIYPEVSLYWHLDMYALWDVDERSTRPYSHSGREFIVTVWNDTTEVLFHNIFMFFET